MEKLWSPWRSQYIDSFKDKKGDEGCVFCRENKMEPETGESMKFYEGKHCFIMMNLYPYNNGHVMVVPRRHLSDFSDLSEEEMNEVMKLVKKVIKALKKIMKPHGFNFGANLGKAAGAGIDQHLHFHIVPRWNGDTNFMPALGEIKVISQDLLTTRNNLAMAFKLIDEEE